MLVITRRRGIQEIVSPTVPANGLRGLAPNVNGSSPPTGLQWTTHSPVYSLGPTLLPGHAFFGADSRGGSGRHHGLGTSVFLVEPGNGNTGSQISGHGTNVYRGTLDWCWRHTAPNTDGCKAMIPLFNGFVQMNNDSNSALGISFVSYWGQFAPSPGMFLRATSLRINGGGDWQVWHMRAYQGDDGPFGDYPVSIRDCFNIGNSGITNAARVAVVNSEFVFSVDELLDAQYPVNGLTLIYNVFTDPLHAPPNLPHPEDPVGTDHGFAVLIGGTSTQPDRVCTMRNVFAHSTGRNPLTSAQKFTHANNLHYNHGRPSVGAGNGIHWHATNNVPMEANILGNVFIRGPNNNNSLVAAACAVTVEAGSGAFLDKNLQHGWAAPAAQNSFMTSAPGGFVQSTYRSNALPSFWGDAALTGVLNIAANPLAPTLAEISAFVDLMDDSCGAQPAYRSASIGRVANTFTQIRDRLAGGSTTNQFLNAVPSWWSIPQVIANPLNPGVHWWAPLPTGSDRDTVLTSGTLINGMSAVGYTTLEAWALNQHYYVTL